MANAFSIANVRRTATPKNSVTNDATDAVSLAFTPVAG
jgi:hypothetical protein